MRKRKLKMYAVLTALMMLVASPVSAQALQKATTKAEPRLIEQTRKQQAKELRSSTDLPTLKVGTKNLQARKNVIKYQQPTSTVAPMQRVTAVDGSNIYGTMIYNSTWTEDNQPAGYYKFAIGDGTTLEQVNVSDDYVALGGGVYANDKVYFVSYMSFMGYVLADLYVCDFETWTVEETIPVDIGSIARDMTYDPVTGNVYGCFYNDDGDGWVFGRMSLSTGEREAICDLDVVFVVMAANSKGDVYGIDLFGDLYKFDKLTGAHTKVGSTGYTPAYSASGCFDLRTDKLYWECLSTDAIARVFEVNTEDASVTLSTILPNSAELISMFIPNPEADDAAPAAVSNLTANFDKDSFSGNITFTLPSQTFAGEDLSGNLDYEVSLNETLYSTGSGVAGSDITVPISVTEAGSYRIAVIAKNSVGNSPVAKLEYWIGYDVPDNVHNLSMTRGDANNKLVLTWDAVSSTVHGGYINPEEVTYRVVRYPDNQVVAENLKETTYTDVLPEKDDLVIYSYGVRAVNGDMESSEATTSSYSYGIASLPFTDDFDDYDIGIDRFYVVDADNDGYTWTHDGINQAARIRYSSANGYTEPKDDWLFTPLFSLKSDRLYYLGFRSRCYMSSEPERLEVKFGKEQSVSAMTNVIYDVQQINNSDYKTFEKYITIPEDGNFSIGFHACSLADKMYLYVDDVVVKEGPLLGTPNYVSDLMAVAGADGAYEATVSFVTPKKTVDGKTLSSLTKVEVLRDGKLVKTFNSPAVNAPLSFTDTEAVQGNNEYTVVAYNEIGAGHSSSVTVFVGYDVPGLVQNVFAKEVNGKVTITWEAPIEGANGGFFDPSVLTYSVLRANDSATIVMNTKNMSATDNNPDTGSYQQEFFAYYVFAQSPAGYGDGQMSNIIPVGEAFAMPFKESFPNASLTNDPWDVETPEDSEAYWSIVTAGESPDVEAQDGDSGLVSFIPSYGNDSSTLYSGKIDFSHAVNPVLEFYYYAPEDCFDYLTVYLAADGNEFEKIDLISYRALTATGWQKESIDLSKYATANSIQLAFTAQSYDGTFNLHFDNIVVKSLYDYNLALTSLSLPDKLKVGSAAKAVATVTNEGIAPASKYSVSLLVNGDVIATQESSESLKADEVKSFTFDFTPTVHFGKEAKICAQVTFDKDMNDLDNTSAVKTLTVTQPHFPAVDDLSALVTDTNVELRWSEPAANTADGQAVTDGAESYKAFAITNIGEWTMIDGDKSETYGIQTSAGTALSYDNACKAMSFMVFNPTKAGISLDMPENSIWAPYSGNQMFTSFAAMSGVNDDWMISPELPGTAQEISFFCKSLTDEYGKEKYEVLYSSAEDEVADFVKLGGVREASTDWEEVKVVLPEGAKYFAIHCVSPDCFVFCVDDIKYLPASAFDEELSLLGYNVYCNKGKLNEAPIEELSYLDSLPDLDDKEYYVTVVYDRGESPISNIVTVKGSGVNTVKASSVSVRTGKHSILVDNAEGKRVSLFTTDGKYITGAVVADSHKFSVSDSGVYIVMVGNEAFRVLVK